MQGVGQAWCLLQSTASDFICFIMFTYQAGFRRGFSLGVGL